MSFEISETTSWRKNGDPSTSQLIQEILTLSGESKIIKNMKEHMYDSELNEVLRNISMEVLVRIQG